MMVAEPQAPMSPQIPMPVSPQHPDCRPARLRLPGPGGLLECRIDCPRGAPRAMALLAHPHPRHGGSLDNKVVHTLARSATALGLIAIRPNFRGVGRSEGAFDHGEGETDDLLGIAGWARRQRPDLPLWLGGFSFGAYVSLRAAASLDIGGLISVAPPVNLFPHQTLAPPPVPWLVLQGEADEIVPSAAVIDWLNRRPGAAELRLLAQAGHFFHGRLGELDREVRGFLDGALGPAANPAPEG